MLPIGNKAHSVYNRYCGPGFGSQDGLDIRLYGFDSHPVHTFWVKNCSLTHRYNRAIINSSSPSCIPYRQIKPRPQVGAYLYINSPARQDTGLIIGGKFLFASRKQRNRRRREREARDGGGSSSQPPTNTNQPATARAWPGTTKSEPARMFVNRKVTHLITEKCTTLAF